jgi:hypothetical protein
MRRKDVGYYACEKGFDNCYTVYFLSNSIIVHDSTYTSFRIQSKILPQVIKTNSENITSDMSSEWNTVHVRWFRRWIDV